MNAETESLLATYTRDGFVFPVDVMSAAEMLPIYHDFLAAERELEDDAQKLALLQSYPDRLLPSFDSLIRHPVLIEAVSQILGPDLLVWSAALFDKAANSNKIVSWHQDLTYWGLDQADELTAWVALSPATVSSGCMQFVPGSHKQQQVAHVDTFAEDNLLSRGQEIAVEVKEGEGVPVVLQPGQASLHHGHLFHSSGPNTTDERRIGAAIRYITPAMKQKGGQRSLVAQVSGKDDFNHFEIAGPTLGRLQPEDFDRCQQDAALKRNVLYEGVEERAGTRY